MESDNDLLGRLSELQAQIVLLFEELLQQLFWTTIEKMENSILSDVRGEAADDVLRGQPCKQEIDRELYANGYGIVSQQIDVNEFDGGNFDNAEQPSAVSEPGTSQSEGSVRQNPEVDPTVVIKGEATGPAAEQSFESPWQPFDNCSEETDVFDGGFDGTNLTVPGQSTLEGSPRSADVHGVRVKRDYLFDEGLEDIPANATPELIFLDEDSRPEDVPHANETVTRTKAEAGSCREGARSSASRRTTSTTESTTRVQDASGGDGPSRRETEVGNVKTEVRTDEPEREDPTRVLPSTSRQAEAMDQAGRSPVFNRTMEDRDFARNCPTAFVPNDELNADPVGNPDGPAVPLKPRKIVARETASTDVASNVPNGPPNGTSAAPLSSRENVSIREAKALLNTLVNLERIKRKIPTRECFARNRENDNLGGPSRGSARERQVGPEGDDDDIIMGSPGGGSQVFRDSRGRDCRRSRSAVDEFVHDPHCCRPHTSGAVDLDETFISPSVVRDFNFPDDRAFHRPASTRQPHKRLAREMSPDYNSVPYAYKRDAIRKRKERMKLPGHACVECNKIAERQKIVPDDVGEGGGFVPGNGFRPNVRLGCGRCPRLLKWTRRFTQAKCRRGYYKQAYGDASTSEFNRMLNLCSRHRDRHPAAFDDTPAGFWTPFLTCTNNCTAEYDRQDDEYENDS